MRLTVLAWARRCGLCNFEYVQDLRPTVGSRFRGDYAPQTFVLIFLDVGFATELGERMVSGAERSNSVTKPLGNRGG